MVTIHGAVYSVLRRYQRRCKIRSIHSTALGLLRDLVIECEKSDVMVMRIIDQSRQLNAIYQGDTLAPPDDISSASSPTTPITASSSRRVADTRRALTHIFNSQWAHWLSALRRLESFSHQGNLSRFRDMYNIIPVAHQQNGSTEEQMHVIHWKRRECLVHLLALDVMTLEHDSDRLDYESHWEVVIKVMGNLVNEYKRHVPTLREHLISSTEVYEDDDERPTRPADPRVNVLLHQYAALEKHVRNIQSKLLLCRQDTRCNQQNQSLERIGDRLGMIEQDITQMLTQWEETTEAYRKLSSASHSLPSPPSSPAGSNNSNKPLMRRSMLTAAAVACFLENKRSREKPLHSTTPSPPPPPSSSSC
ncbi:hypothetical protein K492DRAFT_171877 [Lichtheimia hyalospora FSU 10163]|nr:hypothetical protein K492DRAFT_171877 [Lichtheimia hyalospora FSU 10163]